MERIESIFGTIGDVLYVWSVALRLGDKVRWSSRGVLQARSAAAINGCHVPFSQQGLGSISILFSRHELSNPA